MSSQLDIFYDDFAAQGVRYANALLRNQSDAEEAVQEAFCRLQQANVDEFDESFKGKFFTTLRNHCIDRIRKKTVRREQLSKLDDRPGKASQQAEFNELTGALELAISQLPENWSQSLLMKTHAQLSYDEIAQAMNASVVQVRSWIYRARRQLEENLIASGHLETLKSR